MISRKKVVIEPITGVNETGEKFDQKLLKFAIFLYKNTIKHTRNSISEFG